MAEIDNKKMWESILKRLCKISKPQWLAVIIKQSLEEQGLKWNGEEIVIVKPKQDSQRITSAEAKEALFNYSSSNIQQSFEVGDRVRRKGTNAKGDVITNIYESGGVTMYEFENSEDAPQSMDWELVDPKKETLEELTEFENRLGEILHPSWDIMQGQEDCQFEIEGVKEYAKELMDLARKQMASEIDVDNMCRYIMMSTGVASVGDYKRGIEDCIKAIEKG